jgi:hypothetical protein
MVEMLLFCVFRCAVGGNQSIFEEKMNFMRTDLLLDKILLEATTHIFIVFFNLELSAARSKKNTVKEHVRSLKTSTYWLLGCYDTMHTVSKRFDVIHWPRPRIANPEKMLKHGSSTFILNARKAKKAFWI